jgi:hypothetical protein
MESSLVSGLRRALRYTVGTAIVALLGSNLLSDTDAERLATTAYLAVIFAVVALTALHFVSGGETAQTKRPLVVTFPTALQSVVLVAIVIFVGAALAGQPGAEAFAFLACAAFAAFMALSGGGLFRTLHVSLAAGGVPAALTRYGALAGIVALLLATVLPAEMRGVVVEGACWAVVTVAIALSASLVRRTSLGRFVMAAFKGGPTMTFERMIGYAACACAGALLAAALLPQNGETLAFSAYVAIVIATVGVAVETRISLAAASRRATSISNPR